METRVLITGFEPFGGDSVNPALEAVKKLEGRTMEVDSRIIRIYTCAMPVVFGDAATVLDNAITSVQPTTVICVGQAGGRHHITPERIAINVDDAPSPDNNGNAPIDQPIVHNGPSAYWSTLPIKRMVKAMRDAGIPASVSNSAGTYVCNHLFYQLMHLLTTKYSGMRGGFIHVPCIPEQAVSKPVPTMSLSDIVEGLWIAIRAAVNSEEDVPVADGAEA